MKAPADLLQLLGEATLEPMWLPLAVWTLVCLPLYGALQRCRRAHPLTSYAGHLALLFSLPTALLLAAVLDLPTFFVWHGDDAAAAAAPIPMPVIGLELADSGSAWHWSLAHTLGLATLAACCLSLFRFGRLFLHTAALRHFRRSLKAEAPPPLLDKTAGLARRMGIGRPVRLVLTREPVVPMTFGWRRPVIVLPAGLAGDAHRLEMALVHELVHIRRHDYALQWAEQVVGALFAVHPLSAVLRRAVEHHRELACDAEVLARPAYHPKQYAALLYSFILPASPERFGIGMAENEKHLRRRILAMKSYAQLNRFTHPRLVATLLAGLFILTTGIAVVACTSLVGLEEDTPAAAVPQAQTFVVVEEMPEIVGGLAAVQEHLRYPEIAKKAGIEGRVIVQFIVDEEGNVVDPVIVRGVGSGLDEAALRAVEQVQFKPGRQHGEPVKVKMSLPISFKLPQADSENQDTGALEAAGFHLQFAELARTENEISGRIISAKTGEPLPGVSLVLVGSAIGSETDNNGRFLLRGITLEREVTLRISHPEYPESELHLANEVFESKD